MLKMEYKSRDVLKYLNIYGNLMVSQIGFEDEKIRFKHKNFRRGDLRGDLKVATEQLLHYLMEYQTKIPPKLRKSIGFPLRSVRKGAKEALEELAKHNPEMFKK